MRVAQEKVRQFQEKYNFSRADKPCIPTDEVVDFRLRLMFEELNELEEALYAGDLVAVADGLADLTYTVLGTAVSCGLDLQPVFDEVHASNMTKDPDPGNGKPAKGLDYQPPRIAAIVLQQTLGDQLCQD